MQDDDLLRRNQELLAKLFRNSPAAVGLVRLGDGVMLDINEAYEQLFGWSREEVVGQSTETLRIWADPGDRARFREMIVARGRVIDFASKARRKNGEIFDSLLSAELIEERGERIGLVIVRDVSARNLTEAALRESEQRFRVLTELSSDFYWEQDEQYRFITRVGHTWEQRAYPASEVLGKMRWELAALNMGEEDWKRHRADLEARREFRNLEIERPLPGGGTRWISTSGRPIFDAQGRFRGYRGVGRDITERKHAEEALRESGQRFRALVELSSDWYWVTDAEHRFTFREGEVLHRMGIPPVADYGKRRWEMGFLNMTETDWAAHRALLERREEFRDLLLGRRSADGRVHWATISGRPLHDAAGRFLGYHGTGRDVTEQVNAEESLRKFNVALERTVIERTAELDAANKELEAFTYSVSHDLRAPLRAIEGFSRLLEERHAAALAEEARGQLQRVRAAARRMGQLIEDLIAFSRIGRSELKKRSVDLTALAKLVAKELEAGAPERRIEWRIAEGLAAYADPGLARVVLENLLGNAFKYTGKTPQPLIEFGQTAAGEFMVRDNGAGFDPTHSEGLFQAFRRLHAVEEFEGTGIGLATVRRVVERHGGAVRGEGAVGAGATFYFSLPGDQAAPPRDGSQAW